MFCAPTDFTTRNAEMTRRKPNTTGSLEALGDMDILHSTDAGVLIGYCVAYSRFVAAERQITKEGTVLKVDGSQGQSKDIKHPALMVSSEAQKQMLRAGALIGLNPIDRNRLSRTAETVSRRIR
jgi:P27 family predicted phage terminase small subunit